MTTGLYYLRDFEDAVSVIQITAHFPICVSADIVADGSFLLVFRGVRSLGYSRGRDLLRWDLDFREKEASGERAAGALTGAGGAAAKELSAADRLRSGAGALNAFAADVAKTQGPTPTPTTHHSF